MRLYRHRTTGRVVKLVKFEPCHVNQKRTGRYTVADVDTGQVLPVLYAAQFLKLYERAEVGKVEVGK